MSGEESRSPPITQQDSEYMVLAFQGLHISRDTMAVLHEKRHTVVLAAGTVVPAENLYKSLLQASALLTIMHNSTVNSLTAAGVDTRSLSITRSTRDALLVSIQQPKQVQIS